MSPLTIPVEYTQYLDRAALELRALCPDDARLDRALGLVDTVERTRHPGTWLVPSAQDDGSAYLVTHGTCSCRDAQDRGARCKHQLAVELVERVERLQADTEAPFTITVDPEDSILDLWPGEVPDLAPQCRRCQVEPCAPRHDLGRACISRELFGEEV